MPEGKPASEWTHGWRLALPPPRDCQSGMPRSAGRSPISRRAWLGRLAQSSLACSLLGASASLRGAEGVTAPATATAEAPLPALKFPGPWRFHLPKASIILVSDQQLEDLTDPDREVDLSLSSTPNRTTLRKFCREQQAAGVRTVIVAFDEFWSQYRPGQGGKPRQFTPDTPGYLDRISRIGQVLRSHNLGMELSLLSPLELGPGYTQATGESGRWVHFREGWRDPRTGEYVVELWEQRRWTNNKGTIEPLRAGVRAFAFRERRLGGTRFYAVDPGDIVELTQAPEITAFDPADAKAHQRRSRFTVGAIFNTAGPRDRVLVVVSYTTPGTRLLQSQGACPFSRSWCPLSRKAGSLWTVYTPTKSTSRATGGILIIMMKASSRSAISPRRSRAGSPNCTGPNSPISNAGSSISASDSIPSFQVCNPTPSRST
jgi:hypothetical protein